MSRSTSFAAVASVAVALASCTIGVRQFGPVAAEAGYVSVPEAAFELATVGGEWEFFDGTFVQPGSTARGEIVDIVNAITLAKRMGHFSYRLRVAVGTELPPMGMKADWLFPASRFIVDGQVVHERGKVGTSEADEAPSWDSEPFALPHPGPDGEYEIVIHISNYSDRAGGNVMPLGIGPYRSALEDRRLTFTMDMFLIGALFIMAGYFVFLFLISRKNPEASWFGAICLTLGSRIALYGELFALDLIPGLDWQALMKGGYLTLPLSVLFMTMFMKSAFPTMFHAIPAWISVGVSGLYALAILVLPVSAFTAMLVPFQLVTLAVGAWILAVLILGVRRKVPRTRLVLTGFGVILLAVVHDVLQSLGFLDTDELTPWGIFFFVLIESLIVIRRYSDALSDSEATGERLARMNEAMNRFVPHQMIERLGKEDLGDVELGDCAVGQMSIMFIDIRRFTKLSEGFLPEQGFRFVNDYLGRIVPVINRHGGFVDKFLGDGVLALFPGDPGEAIACALRIGGALRRWNRARKGEGLRPIRVAIGLHTGNLALGTVGSGARMDSTVLSDAVNLASRLEGVAKRFEVGVAVSGETLLLAHARTTFETRFLGNMKVKGKRSPIPVYEVFSCSGKSLCRKKEMKGAYEEGVRACIAHDDAKAAERFKAALEIDPRDGATKRWLKLLERKDALARGREIRP
jgi:class 3 adenylate cyclase